MPECINWCLKAFANVLIVCWSITLYGVWGPQPLKKKLVVLASFVEISLNTWHYQVSDSWYNILRVIRSMNLCSDGCSIKNCGSFEDHAWIILRLKCGFVPMWTLTTNLERGKCFSSSVFLLYVLCHCSHQCNFWKSGDFLLNHNTSCLFWATSLVLRRQSWAEEQE